MLVDNKTVELKNCTVVGNFDNVQSDIWEDCYIIPKDQIDNITDLMQGVKVIKTKPVY